jgi:hypothetical protein
MSTITYRSTSHIVFVAVSYVSRPRIKQQTVFKLVIICSFVIGAFAATDCEILNSGIPAISATDCCTETPGVTCVEDRVTEMYVLIDF